MKSKTMFLALFLTAAGFLSAQQPGVIMSPYARQDSGPTADPNSDFWKGVSGVFIEESILGGKMPNLRAEVRSRWTIDNLYLLFIGSYEKLRMKPDPDTKTETYRLWEWDCFEAYVGADFEHINRYRELQLSPQGEFLDLDIDSTVAHPGHQDERLWNSGMKVKARIDEAKKIWTGEICIPIAAVDKRPAKEGNEMRVNFFRQDGAPPKRDFLAWQVTGVWNPHKPEKFGTLKLAGEPR